MKIPQLFPDVPEDLAALSDEELTALRARYSEVAHLVGEKDEETIEGLTGSEVIEQLTAAVEAIELMDAEIEARKDANEAFNAKLAEETGKIIIKADEAEAEPEAEPETEEADEEAEAETGAEVEVEVKVDAEAEPVVAAAEEETPQPRYPASIPKPSAERRPHISKPSGGFVASAGLSRISPGTEMNRESLARAVSDALDVTLAGGMRQKVIVASAQAEFPEDRVLDARNPGSVQRKVTAVLQGANQGRPMESLVAAAGQEGSCLCAPLTPYYGQMVVSVASRPVRDALVSFRADRGGITFNSPPQLGDITTAVGIITDDECAAGGSIAEKTCQAVDCNVVQSVTVSSIFRCLTFMNLAAKADPEGTSAWTDLAIAAQASAAEQAMLDAIVAASTAVTSTGPNGAINSLLGDIIVAAAELRNHHRMNADATLRVLLPAWSKDLLVTDLIRSMDGRFEKNQAGVEALLRTYGIVPSFYLDSSTAGGQRFPAQIAGTLNSFPTTVEWFIFAEGSFLALDSGSLDLGIVRDSTLNAVNQYQVFAETWEAVAFVGVESLAVTSTVCPSGEVAAPGTALDCSGS